MSDRLQILRRAQKELERLPAQDYERVRDAMLALVLGLGVLLAGGPAAAGEAAPAEVVTKFYSTYQGMERGGLPRPEDQAKLDPLLTPRLRSLLAEARKVQETETRRFPDEKPPFADGDLFSSLFEGFQSFRVGAVETLPDGMYRVEVHFTFEETRWKDAVLVARHDGALLIDDFEFLGDWPFAQKGRLSEHLRAGSEVVRP